MTTQQAADSHRDVTVQAWRIIPLLVLMNGLAPIALYILVPALPLIAQTFGSDISVAQMTVSLFMVGLACSQLIMGPLSDKHGRKPVLLIGFTLMVIASIGSIFADTITQLIVARFFQALGGATGMVMSRAIIRDLYERSRVSSMLSLVIAVMMIAQLLSPLTGGLLEIAFGWHIILIMISLFAIAVTLLIAVLLPETRRPRSDPASGGFLTDVRVLLRSRIFIGFMLCQVLASLIIFTFAGAGPYIVVTHMGRSSAEYGAWFATSGLAYLIGNLFCVRLGTRMPLERLIWIGLVLQIAGSILNLIWGHLGWNLLPSWLFGTHMLVMFGNAFVMANATAGGISIRPDAAGTAAGAMGFMQMGIGALFSQFGAYLGGHFPTPLPTNIAIFGLSAACAASMYVLVQRGQAAINRASS